MSVFILFHCGKVSYHDQIPDWSFNDKDPLDIPYLYQIYHKYWMRPNTQHNAVFKWWYTDERKVPKEIRAALLLLI